MGALKPLLSSEYEPWDWMFPNRSRALISDCSVGYIPLQPQVFLDKGYQRA